ncbi:hypothetical protein FQA47_003429 [Oryzias melastigma]|uniref:FCP1-like phosphatase C-terminal domain-containing protein n=1 Tax=Oryzias melastigma TaxID=30732 RepID=A0A834C6U8_ORYME|nr:hypothetical protein FQA47_003429 [Oryzias melastigma]
MLTPSPHQQALLPALIRRLAEVSHMQLKVDDILGEESDNESEGRGRERPGSEEQEAEEQRRPPPAGHSLGGGVLPQSPAEKLPTASSSDRPSHNVSRGQKMDYTSASNLQVNL